MKKNTIGWIAVIFGGLSLSVEIYMLKFIQMIEAYAGFPWRHSSAAEYIFDPVILLSLLITAFIMLLGIILIIRKQD